MAGKKRDNPLVIPQKRVKRQYDHHQSHANSGVVAKANPTVNDNVPDDILDDIFSFLPVKQVAQIGSGSKRFYKSWLLSRKMIFDLDFYRNHYNQTDFISIASRVFNLHKGPKIDIFCLYFNPIGVESIVESWIQKCIEKGVEELDFDFIQSREPFNIKSEFFDVESIEVLRLYHCNIEIPAKLKNLRFLKTLVLKRTNVSMLMIALVFTNCFLLEFFEVSQLDNIDYLQIYARNHKRFKVLRVTVHHCQFARIDIDAPTLQSFCYIGPPCIIRVCDVSKVNNVMLNFLTLRVGFAQHRKAANIVSDFSHIQVLTMSSTFLEALCSRYVGGHFTSLKYCFWNLKELQLFMDGATFCNLYDIASFLKNCLCIEKVFIDLNNFSFECGVFWELHQKDLIEQDPRIFHRLKFVKIKGFNFQKYELELVKYFLQKALNLEALVLVTPRKNKIKVYAKDIIHYDKMFHGWKASKKAGTFLYEHFDDRSPISPMHPNGFH